MLNHSLPKRKRDDQDLFRHPPIPPFRPDPTILSGGPHSSPQLHTLHNRSDFGTDDGPSSINPPRTRHDTLPTSPTHISSAIGLVAWPGAHDMPNHSRLLDHQSIAKDRSVQFHTRGSLFVPYTISEDGTDDKTVQLSRLCALKDHKSLMKKPTLRFKAKRGIRDRQIERTASSGPGLHHSVSKEEWESVSSVAPRPFSPFGQPLPKMNPVRLPHEPQAHHPFNPYGPTLDADPLNISTSMHLLTQVEPTASSLPKTDPSIKSEFGRIFQGLGSGFAGPLRSISPSSPPSFPAFTDFTDIQLAQPKPITEIKNGPSTSRPFPCCFAQYNCHASFTSKTEWKRHISMKHVQLGFWRCDMCNPSPGLDRPVFNDFNRKDLFRQHLRRMHSLVAQPPTTPGQDGQPQPPPQPASPGTPGHLSDEAIADVQKRCYRVLRTAPQQSECVFCSRVFQGPNSWEERLEHVGAHLERDRINGTNCLDIQSWKKDPALQDYLMREGIVEKDPRGEWRIGDGRPQRTTDLAPPNPSNTNTSSP